MIRLNHQQRLSLLCIAIVLVISVTVIIHGLLHQNDGLDDEIAAYASANAMTIEEVKGNEALMREIKMEAERDKKLESRMEGIEVTQQEIEEYKAMIGNTMDAKKAILIFFNSREECADFIAQHGASDNPEGQGIGIVPQMECDENGGKYYNITGKRILETIYDNLRDGEYYREPLSYSGVYCYLKRLSIESPVTNDEKIAQMIRQQKAERKLQD